MYIQGRSSSVGDILIDFTGGIISVIVFNIIRNFVESLSLLIKRSRNKKKTIKKAKLNKV